MSSLYPVWVGSLPPNATEVDLMKAFSGCGNVVSVKVMKDSEGKSRQFGYINFAREHDAEWAAKFGTAVLIQGRSISVKGPTELEREGHYKRRAAASGATKDYRPLTDCLFFMEKDGCKARDKCPYRHSEKAKRSLSVCKNWERRQCSNKRCPLRHPGTKSTASETSQQKKPKTARDTSRSRRAGNRKAMMHGGSSFSPDSSSCYIDPCGVLGEGLSQSSSSYLEDSDLSSEKGAEEEEELSGFEGDEETSLCSSHLSTTVSSEVERQAGGARRKSNEILVNVSEAEMKEAMFLCSSDSDCTSEETGLGDSVGRLDHSWGERQITSSGSSPCPSPNKTLKKPADFTVRPGKVARRQRVLQQLDISSPSGDGLDVQTMLQPTECEPVGVFWDIENCPIPQEKSPFAVAQKIRKKFFETKREAEFICVCDTMKENAMVTDDLNNAQVTVVHVSAVAKNAADDKLRNAMRKFAHNFSPPATVVLISGDINFAGELSDLRDRHGFNIVLVHNAWTNDQLKAFARKTYLWEEFVEDAENRKERRSSLPTEVVVKGLPSHVSRFHIRERLSMLAGNCGGKVMEVHTTSAVVRFATPELAARAQKRMDRQDAFGFTISVELRTHGAPLPSRTPSNLRPPPPPAALPPPTRDPPPLPYLDNPEPSQPLTHQGRVVVENLSVLGPIEDVQTLKQLKGHLVQMAISAMPPIMIHHEVFLLWDGLRQLSAILTLDVQRTAQTRLDRSLVSMPSMMASYARLTADLRAEGRKNNHEVSLLDSEQELQRKITRSHIIHIMKNYECGWAKFKHFRGHFHAAFDQLCPEVDLKNAAKDVVDLIGPPRKQVVIFAAYNPVVKVKRKPSLEKRLVRLVEQFSEIPLLNLPFQYERMFGPLPYAEDGVELYRVFESLSVCVETSDPSNLEKAVLRRAQVPAALAPPAQPNTDGPSLATKREVFLQECVPVLQEAGGSLPVKRLQPAYQTMYKRSPRASDYGVETLKEIFKTSSLFSMSPDDRVISLVPVRLSSTAAVPQLPAGVRKVSCRPTRDELFAMCVALLKENGGKVAVAEMQQKLQTRFHVSVRLADYGAPSMKELILQCPDISISDRDYCLTPVRLPKSSTNLLSQAEATTDDLSKVKRNIMTVLVSQPDGRVALEDLGSAYQQCINQALDVSRLQGVSSTVELVQSCKPELELVEDQNDYLVQFSDSWLSKQREHFATIAKALLVQREGHCLPYDAFVGEYHRFTGKQLVLVEFGCKTLSGIFQRISSVVQVEKVQQGDGSPGKVIFLADDEKAELHDESQQLSKDALAEESSSLALSLRRDLEHLLCSANGHALTLNKIKPLFQHVMKKDLDYQKAGFAKLILFLESLTKSVVITGEGPARPVSLHPTALLAMNMVKLLGQYPAGLEMSDVVPRYAKQFEFIVVKNFGHKKLQTLLESEMGDLVQVFGYSPMRRVFLKNQALVTAPLSPSVVPALEEPLPLELAYLLFTTEGHQQTSTALETDYLSCFGKKLSVLAKHYECSVTDLIRKSTPLEVEGDGDQAVARLTPSQVFACQTAEVMSLKKDDLRLPPFVAAFEGHFGFSPKPEMYQCDNFEQMLTSAQQFMQIQLAMREGESFVTPSAFSEIFAKLDKARKAEKGKPTAPSADASSQESPESDTEKEKCQPWPSFNTAESSGIDGDASDDRPATQWPDMGSPQSQSDVEDEPDRVEEGKGSDPSLLSGGAVDIPSVTPRDELPVTANVMEQMDNCHLEAGKIPPSIDDLSGPPPSIDGLSGPPPSVVDQSGPPPSVVDQSGPPPSVVDQSGPPPSVVDQSGPTPSVVDQSGPPPSVVDQSGPPPSVVDQSGPPPSVVDKSGPSPSVVDQSGPPPSVIDQSGPPPSVVDQSGPPPSVVDQSGPLPSVVDQSGPLPSVVDQSGPPPSVVDQSRRPPPSIDIPTDTTQPESSSTVLLSAGSNHGNHILPPVVPTGKRAALRQKKGFKMAINFTQSVGVASLQPGGMASIHPVGVAGMQPGGVAGTKSVTSTGTVGGMPPLQDCGDSD